MMVSIKLVSHLREMDKFSTAATLSIRVCLSSEKGSTPHTRICSHCESTFSVRIDPCSEGSWCAEKQTGSYNKSVIGQNLLT